MTFNKEYKEEVFSVLQFNPNAEKVMKALEEDDDLTLRFLFEVVLDELEGQLAPRILVDWGEACIWNSQVNYWFSMNKIYAELMDRIIEEIPDDLVHHSWNSSDTEEED